MRKTRLFAELIVVMALLLSCGSKSVDSYRFSPEQVTAFYPDSTKKVTLAYALHDSTVVQKTIYHHNGRISIRGVLKDSLREGQWQAWDENGRLLTTGNYRQGRDHGEKMVYYPSGSIYYKGQFEQGQRIGKWYFYLPDGSLGKMVDYGPYRPEKNQ